MRMEIVTILFLAALADSRAAVWYVDPAAGSPDPNGSPLSPFATIQSALDTARSGDTLILNPGLYSGPGNYNLDPGGLILTIRSRDPEDFETISETIIDPNYAGHAFIFQNQEGSNFMLYGLTVRNARCEQDDDPPHGSAVFCSEASPTIRFCVFQNCDTDGGWGGAFYGESSHSVIEHCLFVGNKSRYGGALAANVESQIHLNHCTLVGNQAFFNGGGFLCDFESSVIMDNSVVFFNRLQIAENKGRQISVRGSTCSISYSCISAEPNDLEVFRDADLLYKKGIIHTDPNFAFYDRTASWEQLDLHLKSRYGRWDPPSGLWTQDSVTSPCIDAGDPNADWTEEPWPNGKRINLGFYGGTSQASMSGNPADFDGSGKVDLGDLSELVERWLGDLPSDIHDLNKDGRIDLLDLEHFSRQWLRQNTSQADFDLDSDVDVEDLIAFSEEWLQEGPALPQDLSSDGTVNLHDFALFSRQWLWRN